MTQLWEMPIIRAYLAWLPVSTLQVKALTCWQAVLRGYCGCTNSGFEMSVVCKTCKLVLQKPTFRVTTWSHISSGTKIRPGCIWLDLTAMELSSCALSVSKAGELHPFPDLNALDSKSDTFFIFFFLLFILLYSLSSLILYRFLVCKAVSAVLTLRSANLCGMVVCLLNGTALCKSVELEDLHLILFPQGVLLQWCVPWNGLVAQAAMNMNDHKLSSKQWEVSSGASMWKNRNRTNSGDL